MTGRSDGRSVTLGRVELLMQPYMKVNWKINY